MGQADQTVTVARYTRQQYESSSEPYEYLFKIQNKFIQQQEILKLAQEAKGLGVTGFMKIWAQYLKSERADRDSLMEANYTMFSGLDTQLACGQYECDDKGITFFNPAFGTTEVICPHPILPVRRLINFDTNEAKLELAYKRGKTWSRTIVQKSVLASAQKIVALSDQNVCANSENARGLVKFLGYIENENYERIPEVQSIGRLGWVRDGEFSPYVEGLVFDGMAQYEHAFNAVRKQGSYEKWMEVAKEVRAGDSVVARIMLAASFASVLLKPLNALPFIAHCWSNFSGIGKTVALMLAGSVWANPAMGEYVKTFSMTDVGMEMMAAFYGSMPYCLDELCLKDGKKEQFDAMIYKFCQGSGKTRGSKLGGIQKQTVWNCCAISTGEMPLTSGSSKAGAVNRVLDLNAGDVRMFDDPRGAVAILTENYGYAGQDFIDSLKEDGAFDRLRKQQKAFEIELEKAAEDKQAISASIILTADWWATDNIFRDGRALTADDIAPFLQTHDSVNVNKRAYEWLQDVITSNPSRFIAGEHGYVGECWGEATESQAYIIKGVFDRIMAAEGYNPTGFLNWAKGKGLLETDSDGRLTKKKRINGLTGPARCVCMAIGEDVSEEGRGTKKKSGQVAKKVAEQVEQQTVPEGFEQVDDEDVPW